jgi:NADH-quinone oxidoreductase subunit A
MINSIPKSIEQYFPILVFIGIASFLSIVMVGLPYLLAIKQPTKNKLSTYECGFDPIGDTRKIFDVRFYLVAILFIIFDLEIAFLFPWAIVLKKIGWCGFISMVSFLSMLAIGFIYEWKKGALEWE